MRPDKELNASWQMAAFTVIFKAKVIIIAEASCGERTSRKS
jgi:hypothetical protein